MGVDRIARRLMEASEFWWCVEGLKGCGWGWTGSVGGLSPHLPSPLIIIPPSSMVGPIPILQFPYAISIYAILYAISICNFHI